MATWGVHIRIAEELLKIMHNLDPKDWSKFSPPTEISHFMNDNRKIDSDSFVYSHLSKDYKNNELSFLLGYYSHLLADVEWSKMVQELIESNEDYAILNTDKKFIWTIKKDWYDLDHVYFRDNPENIFWTIFQHIEDFPNYLGYYPEGAIIRQIKYISNFYNNPPENLDREYRYLSTNDMNKFISPTVQLIYDKISLVDCRTVSGV
jgi:hypothetical protein